MVLAMAKDKRVELSSCDRLITRTLKARADKQLKKQGKQVKYTRLLRRRLRNFKNKMNWKIVSFIFRPDAITKLPTYFFKACGTRGISGNYKSNHKSKLEELG
jgi:hypothetical protein